ncbi:MAG: VaFE repeat-containing surface-anchored protein [Eggerthellaceae bacterium]|nr:VaFE repeat-containing surface-anchored protein [Eggerthellaceae bacterium]
MNRETKSTAGKAMRVLMAALLVATAAVPLLTARPGRAHAAEQVYLTTYMEYPWFKVGDTIAYCASPSKPSPPSGYYNKHESDPEDAGRLGELAADLYYGWGGPGFDASMWPSTDYDGSPMDADRYQTYTHVLVADTYSSDGGYAVSDQSPEARAWILRHIVGFDGDGEHSDAFGRKVYAKYAAGEVPKGFSTYVLEPGGGYQNIVCWEWLKGDLKVKKQSADTAVTEGNSQYSYAGAVFGVYEDSACSELASRITTNKSGEGELKDLAAGTYWVKELEAPPGYTLDEGGPYKAEVPAGGDVTVKVKNQPVTVRLTLKKFDDGTGKALPEGDASLDGAEYAVTYRYAGESKTVKGTSANAQIVFEGIPLGDITVKETKAPEGYLPDTRTHSFRVTADMCDQSIATFELVPENEFGETVQRGGFMVGKGDAEEYEHEDGTYWNYAQGDATFEGAEFTVYNRSEAEVWVDRNGDGDCAANEMYAPDDEIMTVPTTYNAALDAWVASTGARALPYGTYEVVETKAPEGYLHEGTLSRTIEIREDGQFDQLVAADGILNEVIRGGVMVRKDDRELKESEALGGANHSELGVDGYLGASLCGIEFTITNRSEHGVMVAGEYYGPDAIIMRIYTAWNEEQQAYTAQTPSDALPYGTYEVAETGTNESYLLSDGEPRTFLIRTDGDVVRKSHDNKNLTWRDQVVRHDMHLQKKGEVGDKKLAYVPFLITNVTTGEAHVAVTDRNGMLNTSAGWRAHSANTNANDALIGREAIASADIVEDAGIWFGLGEHGTTAGADDSLGALPYGEYTIQEMRCEANEGYCLWSDSFNVSRDTTATEFDVDLGTVDDEPLPEIATTAADADDGDHAATADDTVVLNDVVEYANLVPGKEYTLTGTLMDKQTEEPVLSGGEPVTASTTFKPISPYGTVNVTFEFDAEGFAGHDVVAFESLSLDGTELAAHADIDDEGQTVTLTPPPAIGTTACDAADGDHEVAASDKAIVQDQVRYENLTPKKRYQLVGTLMDRETGEPVQGESGTATCVLWFNAKEASGTVTVGFTVDATELAGHALVCFEELYSDGELVAEHADIDDEGQTVEVVPPEPEIGTTATDAADGDHEAVAGKTVKVDDAVAYENLTPGEEYRLVGTLIDKETARPLESGGKEVTAEASFTPEEPSGTAVVSFEFDGSALSSHGLVAYEYLYDGDGVEVAKHVDPSDEGQTVAIVPPEEKPVPKLSTQAVDAADGDHEIAAGEAEIVDEVMYEGLTPGENYTVTGTLMDKETGKPVQSGGKDVTTTVAFTPEKASGSVKVTFKVDAGNLAGKTLVAFESLSLGGEEIATHADIGSAEQSVTVANPPEETPLGPIPGLPLPKTGDTMQWVPIACFAAAAACLATIALLARRRGMKREGDGLDPGCEEDDEDEEEPYWQDVRWE